MTKPTLSVIIPAYNEAARITPTLDALVATLAQTPGRHEVLVVDDGSTDATVAVCEDYARLRRSSLVDIQVVCTMPNRGKGHAVRTGMLCARGDVLAMLDADGSIPPSEMMRLVGPVARRECHVAIASRYAIGAKQATVQPLFRRVWSRLCNQVIRRTIVRGLRDTQCGCKVFQREAARELFARCEVNGWAFDLEVLGLAQRRAMSIREVGVQWQDDARSRVSPVRDLGRVIREAIAIRRRLGSRSALLVA